MFESLTYKDRWRTGKTRSGARITASLVLHGAILMLLLHPASTPAVRVLLLGTDRGTNIALFYAPGRRVSPDADTKTRQSHPAVKRAERAQDAKPEIRLAPPLVESPAAEGDASTPAAQGANGAAGNDALGYGDIQIALTTFSPSPAPDLSQLPRGTQGDVVIDVTIDPTGRVADLQVLHALGYGVEGAVLETVRKWTFRPATKDGVAVASVQELHFHFGPA